MIVVKQSQTHNHEPRASIKGDGESQPGVSSCLQPTEIAKKWVLNSTLLGLATIANVGAIP